MKDVDFHPDVLSKITQIRKKDPKFYKKIKKQLILFQQNPYHRSLRTHKLTGKLKNVWSISISKSIRMLYIDSDSYYFIQIGTHDEVYK